jgi:hypothetical protein
VLGTLRIADGSQAVAPLHCLTAVVIEVIPIGSFKMINSKLLFPFE